MTLASVILVVFLPTNHKYVLKDDLFSTNDIYFTDKLRLRSIYCLRGGEFSTPSQHSFIGK